MTPSARARISLSALRHNLQVIRGNAAGQRVMAVVKGNAYGHGMIPVAKALPDVDSFAVARLSEAIGLRNAGIQQPIVLLGGVVSNLDLFNAARHEITVCVQNAAQIEWLEAYTGSRFDVWLKVDTGMNRLGIDLTDARHALDRLQACASVNELGVMTHFANADDPGDDTTNTQIERFQTVIVGFKGAISVANSAAIFGFPNALSRLTHACPGQAIWIRPGISLFGVSPIIGHCGAALGLRPAMRFESQLIAVRPLRSGDKVGYGGDWAAERNTMIGIIAVGYGDGYTGTISGMTPVAVNGRRVPIIGRVSMDLAAVDLGPNAKERLSDRVVLWGDDLPVETVAASAGTGAYQLMTGVMHREPPVYVD